MRLPAKIIDYNIDFRTENTFRYEQFEQKTKVSAKSENSKIDVPDSNDTRRNLI